MQMWQCPLLLLSVSLIAAINTQQMPSQRLEPNQVAELVEQQQQQQQHQAHTQQQQQPQQQQTREVSKAENKDYHHPSAPAILLQLTPSDWKSADDKRNWNRMQGMWGKRSQELEEMTPQRLVKRAWSDLTKQGWGKRSWTQLHGAWGKRRWDQLHGAWGKRVPLDGQQSEEVDEDVVDVDDDDDSSLETDQVNALEKRSGWNKMQGVWGKRSGVDNNDVLVTVDDDYQRDDDNLRDDSAQDGGQDNGEELKDKRSWNKMQGAWGKRALSAMAAGYKRNWNNLRGAWGKREMPAALAKGIEWSRKRESGWNNLKGLWG